jgi:glucose/arabinose dehydrogenase
LKSGLSRFYFDISQVDFKIINKMISNINVFSLRFAYFLFLILFSCSFQNKETSNHSSKGSGAAAVSYSISLKEIASGLEAPVGLTYADDGTGRLFVIEQTGTIRIIRNGQLLDAPFLNISDRLDGLGSGYSEKGLLGLAFHPDYPTNGKFYVYYSAPTSAKGMDHKSVIAEYTTSSNVDKAGLDERIILEIQEPESNHNGGQLCFGPDGYLYIGVGDGGGAGDKHGSIGNGQNINTLLGKILRIDINITSGYTNPPDNPFVNKNGNDEIFAVGLRNPWRFSFDRKTGELFCADVGQNEYEEVDIIEKGKNYGWRIMEATHCYNPSTNCNTSGLTLPIDEYDHSIGISIIGGFVYRGAETEDMNGRYIFGDWNGKIFMLLQPAGSKNWERRSMTIKNASDDLHINSFGEDANGNLYVLAQNSIGVKKAGKVYQIVF